ncbi:Protein Iojap, chloroplast [Capsicum annuum]|uniref:Protein Iojap, chloroplast n=2 Tax=Capsicum annuum TaxID=4072 RepID=A0A2G2Z5G6_CAPAN|nr:Protein Iojap, chloroplast [Capsicum annuum]
MWKNPCVEPVTPLGSGPPLQVAAPCVEPVTSLVTTGHDWAQLSQAKWEKRDGTSIAKEGENTGTVLDKQGDSAGKGTKTDWMMHEFRLPAENDKSTKHSQAKSIAQEALKLQVMSRLKVLFVKPLVYWTRFFIIATAFSRPQIDAIGTRIRDMAEEQYGKVASGDSKPSSWTLLDFAARVLLSGRILSIAMQHPSKCHLRTNKNCEDVAVIEVPTFWPRGD